MDKKVCKKLSKGELEYRVDQEKRKIYLISDTPKKGKKGATFSHDEIDFDKINSILGEPGNILNKSMGLQPCFDATGSNNGPMLAAVLMDLGIIDKDYKVINLL